MAWKLLFGIVRMAAIVVSLYLILDLSRQFADGSISMGHGMFRDRITVTSVSGRMLTVREMTDFHEDG
jgi:hypothetical protein